MNTLIRIFTGSLLLWAIAIPVELRAEEQCKPEQFAVLIDDTGKYLSSFSQQSKPALHEKFSRLAQQNDWPSDLAEERGYRAIQDTKTRDYDTRARQLLIELDKIDASAETNSTCANLERLKSVTMELRSVTEAKFRHMLAKADQLLDKRPPASSPPQPRPTPAKPHPEVALKKPEPPPAARRTPWQTTTEPPPQPSSQPNEVLRVLPRPEPMPATTTFSPIEIREAGRGLFGNISAGLASVINYTFETYGAPNGYIIGTEGGAAFLAGLSFGEGSLNTKTSSPLKVYWQGPSVGYDLGLQGSRVMFLVYNLEQPEKIFARYGGIGGSAYIVGGVGLTYHMRGNVVLAPIRTGLGLRLGANIGYLKFTPRLSINPF